MDTIPEESRMLCETDTSEEPVLNGTNLRRGFNIKVACLENMESIKKIVVKVDLNEKSIGESEKTLVQDKEVELNWEIFFEIPEGTENVLDELISNPLVFRVLYETVSSEEEEPTTHNKDKMEKVKSSKSPREKEKSIKDTSVSNRSKKTNKSAKSKIISQNSETFAVLGICNLDLLPLILGQTAEIEEDLFLNSTAEHRGSDITAWGNLPKLKVSVSITEDIVNDIPWSVSNILLFTLESLHNINPDSSREVEASTRLPNNQVIQFKSGTVVLDDSVWVSKRKKWYGLQDLPGQGALSSYKVPDDSLQWLFNTMDYELNNNSLTKPRIQWNQIHRSFLSADMEKVFKEKIVKHNYWPIEILVPSSTAHKNIEHDKGKRKTEKPSNGQRDKFVALLDLSTLIYPGEKSIRLTSQLYTYTEESMKAMFGSVTILFDESTTPSVQEVKPKSASSKKDAKPGSTKSKKSSVKSKEGKKKAEEIKELNQDEPIPQKELEPVLNDEGDPIFVVVQVDLFKPLIEKRTEETTLESIHKIIPERECPTTKQLQTINYSRMYEECVKNLIHNIHEEYQIFFNGNESHKNSSRNFLMHLQVRGVYTKMAESMKQGLRAQVTETLGPEDSWGRMKHTCQDVLTCLYQELANKMYTIVSSIADPSLMKYESEVSSDDLKYYESEALEEGDFNKAHNYLLQRLEKSEKANPQVWIDFGMYWKNKLEFEKAEECSKESVSLEPRHTNALMFHGLLCWLMEDCEVAEMCLSGVVIFTPSCLEAWVMLYMLHKQIGKHTEASVELIHAKECRKRFVMPNNEGISNLHWHPDLSETSSIFLLTAAKLLNLSFPEFAELALSYDLRVHGRTVNYLYYLAVCHYQQGRYASSIVHLEEALKMHWENYKLWALKAHCLYKLQKQQEAKAAYQVALNFIDQEDQHLIKLRLGNILMAEEDYKSGRDCYMSICRDSPTPLSWLCLGISAFVDDNMEAAELALTEANTLDCRIGRVWGYLALVNLMLDRPHIFNKCILQAYKYGFDDHFLMERIDSLVKLVQPSDE